MSVITVASCCGGGGLKALIRFESLSYYKCLGWYKSLTSGILKMTWRMYWNPSYLHIFPHHKDIIPETRQLVSTLRDI